MTMTFRERFRQLLDEAPEDREAVEFDGAWTTWGTLQAVASSLDSALTARGLGVGSRVGVVLENRPEHVAVLLGVLATGRTVVTFSGLQPPARLAADIARAEVPAVVGRSEFWSGEDVRAAAGEALVMELSEDRVTTTQPIEPKSPGSNALAPGVEIEMLTSGTTGAPKRVLLLERQFATALATSVPEPLPDALFRSGTTIVAAPMVHIGGLWGALSPIYTGRRICLLARFELEPWLAAVERHRPRASGLVPAALRSILETDVPAARLASLQVITSGTTYCPTEIVDGMLEKYGIRVLPTYGATEFAGAIAMWSLRMHEKHWESKKGAAGRPIRGVELRVSRPGGEVLEAGQEGILEVRSAQSPLGPAEWQRTSDLAVIDADGFVWIRGRTDDAIIRGGFKIQPETVRAALEQHPAVREAAVAPWPDERLGAVPVAGVELEEGADVPTGQALRDHCRTLLLPYEVPVHVVVLDELPRTPSHKVSRDDLLDQIRAAISRGVPAA